MIVCFPAEADKGEDSVIFQHFAASPGFVLYNDETAEFSFLENPDAGKKGAGSRGSSDMLSDAGVSVLVAGGIGDGAINRLNSLGIEVCWAHAGMVKYDLKLYLSGMLKKADKGDCDGSFR